MWLSRRKECERGHISYSRDHGHTQCDCYHTKCDCGHTQCDCHHTQCDCGHTQCDWDDIKCDCGHIKRDCGHTTLLWPHNVTEDTQNVIVTTHNVIVATHNVTEDTQNVIVTTHNVTVAIQCDCDHTQCDCDHTQCDCGRTVSVTQASNDITHWAEFRHVHDMVQLVLNLLDELAHFQRKFHLQVFDRSVWSVRGSLQLILGNVTDCLPADLFVRLHRPTVLRACVSRRRRLTFRSKMQNHSKYYYYQSLLKGKVSK